MTVRDLPTLNAALNALATLFLVFGYRYIRRGQIEAHRTCMLAAFGTSILFLISYLIYHAYVGSVPFPGTGWVRTVYFTILVSHVILAAIVPWLAIVTLYRGLRMERERHRRLARWTFPIWMYVSLTGVWIYVMLYVVYDAA